MDFISSKFRSEFENQVSHIWVQHIAVIPVLRKHTTIIQIQFLFVMDRRMYVQDENNYCCVKVEEIENFT
jgi:hypothetical protein